MIAAMQTWADGQKYQLMSLHPGWQIWYVPKFPQRGYTWHARPKGAPAATHSADSPEELSAAISAAGGVR